MEWKEQERVGNKTSEFKENEPTEIGGNKRRNKKDKKEIKRRMNRKEDREVRTTRQEIGKGRI